MTKRPFKDKKLTLTNDGQLSFFFVGVGSAFSKRHYQTNLLIVKGDDHLMVDCGTKTPRPFTSLAPQSPIYRTFTSPTPTLTT
jgi:hypothetical protein